MAVRERVMISRLIEKIELQSDYASKIGLSCQLATTRAKAKGSSSVQKLGLEKNL